MERIPKALNEIIHQVDPLNHLDVITFAEADISNERENMLQKFHDEGFHYSTSILHDVDPFTRFSIIYYIIEIFIDSIT